MWISQLLRPVHLKLHVKIAPISDLRKKSESEFQWTDKCQRAFERLKSELVSKPVVQPYSLKKEVTITTDASEKAIGGVLSQEGHPVIYVSKTLSQAEQRYSNIEREALAIVFVVKRLKQFLLGRKFNLETDHRPLEFIFAPNKELPKTVSARITRWAISLMAFDYEIKYKEGSSIPHADAMSRLKFDNDDDECNLVDYSSSNFDEFCVHYAEHKLIPFEELRSECERDELAKRIIRRVIDGDWKACTKVESFFKKVSGLLTVENGLLYNGTRPYIPPRMRNIVIERAHDTHPGVQATKNVVNLMSWWPGVGKDVEKFISACSESAKIRPRTEKSIDTWPDAQPWERLHMDWAYIQEVGNILIIVDAGSGWIEAFICGDRPTEKVIHCLSAFFGRFGVPHTLVSDNTKEFINDKVVTWLQAQDCTKLESPIYNPRSNGLAERAVQTVKKAMRAWNSSLRVSFHAFLQRVLFTHRNTSSVRGKTPSEVLLGRKMRLPAVINYPIGERVVFRAGPHTESFPARYVVRKGNNTA